MAEKELSKIEALVRNHEGGLSLQQISDGLKNTIPRRTLQRYLKLLVDKGSLRTTGDGRGLKYSAFQFDSNKDKEHIESESIPISKEGRAIQKYVSQLLIKRKAVGYNRDFLDSYKANKTAYLSKEDRNHLKTIGTVGASKQPAGTYARMIFDRLLIHHQTEHGIRVTVKYRVLVSECQRCSGAVLFYALLCEQNRRNELFSAIA